MMRWKCPKCGDGKLAPSRPRKDDSRVFCFKCSEETGRLVHRVAPAKLTAVAKDQARAQVRKAANAAKREAQRAAAQVAKGQERDAKRLLRQLPIGQVLRMRTHGALLEAAHRYMKLKAWERPIDAKIVIRFSNRQQHASGHAWPHSSALDTAKGRMVVTVGSDIADAHATILHEIAHIAAGTGHGHDFRWWSFFKLATMELTGIEPTPVEITHYGLHDSVQRVMAVYLTSGITSSGSVQV